jgi:hypothetical protein
MPSWAALFDVPQPIVAVLSLQAAAGNHVAWRCSPMDSAGIFVSIAWTMQQVVEMAFHSGGPCL